MNKKYTIVIAAAAILYAIYHIATLIYSPFPWFDEITFASMTESYMKHHTFYEDARIIVIPEQKLQYGPVYFLLQALVLKTFGFGIFHFRMTNLLFGFINLYLIYKICMKLGFTASAAMVTLILVAIEPNFNQFLHSGRMDFVCLFFFMNAYLLYTEIKPGKMLVPLSLLVGLLLGCAFLTTPRIIFAFASFAFFFIYEMYVADGGGRKATLLKYALIGVAFGAIYYLWVYKAYGSIGGLITSNKNSTTMKEHVGIGSNIRIGYNFFVFLYAFLAFFLIVKNKLLAKNIALAALCLPAIIAFILLVTGGISGRYFALVTPFTSLLIVGVTVNLLTGKLLKWLTYTICILFGCIFAFKGVYILSTMPQHDPVANEKTISQYLTKNTSVCGDFAYYYIARNNGCTFLSLEENGGLDQKAQYIIDKKIKYIIIGKGNTWRPLYQEAFLNNHYKLVAEVNDQNYSNTFSRLIKKLPYMISDSYACYIYEYVGG